MDARSLLTRVPAFEARQAARLRERGIDTSGMSMSHVAVRTRTWGEYLALRDELEALSLANLENVWNGRPISKLLLRQPVAISHDRSVGLVELIPPFHQRVYALGLEHVGYVVGAALTAFEDEHLDVLTGKQFQSRVCAPAYVLFAEDYTHAKFYERSLHDVCVLEGATFEGFRHADWAPRDPDAGPYEIG